MKGKVRDLSKMIFMLSPLLPLFALGRHKHMWVFVVFYIPLLVSLTPFVKHSRIDAVGLAYGIVAFSIGLLLAYLSSLWYLLLSVMELIYLTSSAPEAD